MSVDPYAVGNEILARIQTIPNIPIFEDRVPDGEALPLDGQGRIRPHLVLAYAGLTEPPSGINGIAGAQYDSFLQQFSVHAIAGDSDAARQVHSIALGKLLGFVPAGCSEIRPAFFGGIGQISSLSAPTRYSAVQAYKFIINPL